LSNGGKLSRAIIAVISYFSITIKPEYAFGYSGFLFLYLWLNFAAIFNEINE